MRRRSALVIATARSMSNATAPSPTQIGRYGERNGMTASSQPDGDVAVTHRGDDVHPDRARCRRTTGSDAPIGRGSEASVSLVHPTDATVPSTTVAESRISDTRPVARVRYHSAVEPWPTVASTARRHRRDSTSGARCGRLSHPARVGPACECRRPSPSSRDEARREPVVLPASRRRAAPSTIAAVDAAFACTQVAAAVETVRQQGAARQPGGRVHNVVDLVCAQSPVAHADARRSRARPTRWRSPRRGQERCRCRRCRWRTRRLVPGRLRTRRRRARRARHTRAGVDGRRRSVRRQRLGCRAEVEGGVRREADTARRLRSTETERHPGTARFRREFAVDPASARRRNRGRSPGRFMATRRSGRPAHRSPRPWRARRRSPRSRSWLTTTSVTRGGVEPAQLRVAPEPAGHEVDALELRFEHLRRRDRVRPASVTTLSAMDAEGPGPVDVLAVGGGVRLGHQVDPLVTGGGAEAACGGVDGGLSEFGELEAPAPWPLLPARAPLAVVLPRCWSPRGAPAGPWRRRRRAPPTAATVATAMAASDARQPVQRTVAAQGCRTAALRRARPVRTRAMRSRVRTHPDAYMKNEPAQAKDSRKSSSPIWSGLPLPRRQLFARRPPAGAAQLGDPDRPLALGGADDRVGDGQTEAGARHRVRGPVEPVEHGVPLVLWDPGTGVVDAEIDPGAPVADADLDPALLRPRTCTRCR